MIPADIPILDTFAAAERPVVFLDFDGVLSEIVDDPAETVPLPGTGNVLARLIAGGTTVCVLSSRPADFLSEHLGTVPDLTLIGNKGLRARQNGVVWEHDDAAQIEQAVSEADRSIRSRLAELNLEPGVRLENKGLSLTVHYRPPTGDHPSDEELTRRRAGAERIARDAADAADLEVVEGKMAFELEPNKGVDKGTTIRSRIADHDWALFAGDDVGDLVGFEAIGDLEQRLPAFSIGVASDQEPDGLRNATNIMVDGPTGMHDLLKLLASVRS